MGAGVGAVDPLLADANFRGQGEQGFDGEVGVAVAIAQVCVIIDPSVGLHDHIHQMHGSCFAIDGFDDNAAGSTLNVILGHVGSLP